MSLSMSQVAPPSLSSALLLTRAHMALVKSTALYREGGVILDTDFVCSYRCCSLNIRHCQSLCVCMCVSLSLCVCMLTSDMIKHYLTDESKAVRAE